MPIHFSEEIKRLLEERGISRKEFAVNLGIPDYQLSARLRHRWVTLEGLNKFAEALYMTPEAVLMHVAKGRLTEFEILNRSNDYYKKIRAWCQKACSDFSHLCEEEVREVRDKVNQSYLKAVANKGKPEEGVDHVIYWATYRSDEAIAALEMFTKAHCNFKFWAPVFSAKGKQNMGTDFFDYEYLSQLIPLEQPTHSTQLFMYGTHYQPRSAKKEGEYYIDYAVIAFVRLPQLEVPLILTMQAHRIAAIGIMRLLSSPKLIKEVMIVPAKEARLDIGRYFEAVIEISVKRTRYPEDLRLHDEDIKLARDTQKHLAIYPWRYYLL